MPLENKEESTKNAADNTKQQPKDLVRCSRQEADRNKKDSLDALPSFYEHLQDPDYVNTRDKGHPPQILEPVSREDQFMSGSFDSIRRLLNPSLAKALQTQWEDQKGSLCDLSNASKVKEVDAIDKLQEIDRLEHTSLYNPASGWQGTPRNTLEGLVRKALEELDIQSYSDKDTLVEKGLYPLYYRDSQKPKSSTFDQQVIFDEHSFDTITYPHTQTQKFVHSDWVSFVNIKTYQQVRTEKSIYLMRMILNVKPDRVMDVTQQVVDTVSKLDYVSSVKIAKNISTAEKRFDNMIIYFSDPTRKKNLEDLARRLEKHADDTRPGHSAMLAPIHPEIQGIAFADDCYDQVTECLSWGKRRLERIAEIMLALKSQGADFKTTMSEVDKRFRERPYAIDPENPAWYIHEEN